MFRHDLRQVMQTSNHFLWIVVPVKSAFYSCNRFRVALLAVSDVERWGKQGGLSDADSVGKGSQSGEWPSMSLCGFDKDRDLCSSSVYGSGPLWQCVLRPAATSVATSWEGGGYRKQLPSLLPHLFHSITTIELGPSTERLVAQRLMESSLIKHL